MPIYQIKETKQAIEVWEYEVVANSQEEAMEKIIEGTVEPVGYYVVGDEFEDCEYYLTEVEK